MSYDRKFPQAVMTELSVSRRSEKTLKAKEEIANKREVIQRRMNFISSSHNDEEAVGPLQLIPEEGIWAKILDCLEDVSDLCSAYNTCTLFREIVVKKRQTALLKQVLTILRGTSFLPKPDILNLRLVSKPFKRMVEEVFYENDFLDKEWSPKKTFTIDYDYYPVIKDTATVNQIISSLTQGDSNHEPQLFTRTLIVSEEQFVRETNNLNLLNEFHGLVQQLLRLCGHSIWGIGYKFNNRPEFRSSWRMVDIIRDTLLLLPNLKSLKIESSPAHIDGNASGELTQDEIILDNFIRENPFPFNPSLLYVHEHGMPTPIAIGIFRTNLNIKWVSAITLKILNVQICDTLSHLHLEKFLALRFSPQVYPVFLGMQPWPVNTLILTEFSLDFTWRSSDLFRLLSKFGETLKNLELYLDVVDTGGFLELPKLTNFTCRLLRSLHTLDFLIPAKSLEHIKVDLDGHDVFYTECGWEVVKFRGFMLRLHESNIWQCFPSLKTVVLDGGWRGWNRKFERRWNGAVLVQNQERRTDGG